MYPSDWNEFEDTEESFLFYNPDNWTGNFRISAFRKDPKEPDADTFGKDSVEKELKRSPSPERVKIGGLECAYSKEVLEEEGKWYDTHFWVTGIGNISFECSFTVPRDVDAKPAESIIGTLEIRKEGSKYPPEIIPVRVAEIARIDESYDWAVSVVKKLLKKDFQGTEEDIPKLQQIIDNGHIAPGQREEWLHVGIALCIIVANETDDLEWMTLIDGNREAPVLYHAETKTTIDPMSHVWSKIKAGGRCNVVEEYNHIMANPG